MNIEAAANHSSAKPSAYLPGFPRYAGYRLSGCLDLSVLRPAWQTAVRTLGDAVTADPVVFTDVTALSVDDVDALAAALCGRWATEPASSAPGPRAGLFAARLTATDLVLFVRVDHETTDEGFGLLLDALSAAYLRGRGKAETCEDGLPGGIRPVVAPAAPVQAHPRYEGGVLPFSWDGDQVRQVGETAAARDASPAGVVLAAFRALLLRHGGYTGDGTFDRLLGLVPRPPRGAWSVPQHDAVFVDRSAAPAVSRLAGLPARPVVPDRVPVTTGLALVLDTVSPRLSGRLEYRKSVYDAAAAADVLERFRTLLEVAVNAPDTPVAALPPHTPDAAVAERYAALPAFTPVGGSEPVHVRVAAHARTTAPAVEWRGDTTDYASLDAIALDVARRLAAAGVGHGDAVAVRMPPGPLRIAALLGVLSRGAQLLWLAPGSAGERGRSMLATLRPSCVVVEGEHGADELLVWYRDELGGRVLDVAGEPSKSAPAGLTPEVAPTDLAYVAFTSGSTGRPKGIPQSHAALSQFAHWMGTQFAMGPGARVVQWVSPEHDPALAEVCATLVAGGTLHVVPDDIRINPDRLVPWLAEQRITHIQTVPSFARDLLDVITQTGAGPRLGALSHILLMGEALPAELVAGLGAALPTARVFNLYGPTEVVAATWHEVTGTTRGPVPIGRPIPGRQLLILDEHDLTCPVGVTGTIVVRSPYVTPGYLGSDDRTPFRPVEWLDGPGTTAGWYRTGDLGRRLPDGAVEFRGREDFQIKLSGNRVELTEIEASLSSHASVLECAVVPVVEETSGLIRRLAVHVVPRRDDDGQPVGSASEWRAHLGRHFGPLNLPATFHRATGRLPRNTAGKVDRSRLRAQTLAA
ncbi:AMP-binding protein [Streptomyces sp. NPDC101160]|uniref:AMP-binding protein n=1 Tax=Streptomyces sp. NPDC101160 TaxID=3366118 RepID=UPI0037F1ACA8